MSACAIAVALMLAALVIGGMVAASDGPVPMTPQTAPQQPVPFEEGP